MLFLEGFEDNRDRIHTVLGINSCLQAMKLHEHLLPVIGQNDSVSVDGEWLLFWRSQIAATQTESATINELRFVTNTGLLPNKLPA